MSEAARPGGWQLSVYLRVADHERLVMIAKQRGVTVSRLAREFIQAELDQRNREAQQ